MKHIINYHERHVAADIAPEFNVSPHGTVQMLDVAKVGPELRYRFVVIEPLDPPARTTASGVPSPTEQADGDPLPPKPRPRKPRDV